MTAIRNFHRYYEGCDMTLTDLANGTLSSPAFGTGAPYPHNQECTYRVAHPDGPGGGRRVSMVFRHLDLHPSDTVQVRQGVTHFFRALRGAKKVTVLHFVRLRG